MKPSTREWIEKAEGDFASMEREYRARKRPNYDGLCFHAQQCAEKYIKARLVEANIDFPKIHDLVALLDLVLPVEPLWEALREHLVFSLLSPSIIAIPASPLIAKPHWMRVAVAGCSAKWHVKRLGGKHKPLLRQPHMQTAFLSSSRLRFNHTLEVGEKKHDYRPTI